MNILAVEQNTDLDHFGFQYPDNVATLCNAEWSDVLAALSNPRFDAVIFRPSDPDRPKWFDIIREMLLKHGDKICDLNITIPTDPTISVNLDELDGRIKLFSDINDPAIFKWKEELKNIIEVMRHFSTNSYLGISSYFQNSQIDSYHEHMGMITAICAYGRPLGTQLLPDSDEINGIIYPCPEDAIIFLKPKITHNSPPICGVVFIASSFTNLR